MKGLTSRQKEVLHYIESFIQKNHHSPSYREIMDNFSLRSPSGVYRLVHALIRKGVLTGEKKCSRSIKPTRSTIPLSQSREIQLPFVGNISAGYSMELFVESKTLLVPSSLVHTPENTYVIRNQGDGFQDEFIQDGDLLIIEARQQAETGETILGIVNQNDTVIKRYYPDGQYIRLESAHSHHHPLILRPDYLTIQGVLSGLIRAY